MSPWRVHPSLQAKPLNQRRRLAQQKSVTSMCAKECRLGTGAGCPAISQSSESDWDRKPNGDGTNLSIVWQELAGPTVKTEAQSGYGVRREGAFQWVQAADLFRAPLRKRRTRHHGSMLKESSSSTRIFWNGGAAKKTSREG
jgi:hypothetical protein